MKNDTLQIAFWSLSRQCSIHLTFQRQWQRMALLHGNVWNNWHVLTLTIFFCKRELKWARKPLDSLVRAPKEALWVLMASCSRIIPIPTEADVSFVWYVGSQHAEAQALWLYQPETTALGQAPWESAPAHLLLSWALAGARGRSRAGWQLCAHCLLWSPSVKTIQLGHSFL